MITKQDLIHTVTRIEMEQPDGSNHLGTGFFFQYETNERINYLLVSNRHVFENNTKFKFAIPFLQQNKIIRLDVEITTTPLLHDFYDLAGIQINSLMDQYNMSNDKPYIHFISKSELVNDNMDISNIEYAIMIGYPAAIQADKFFSLPLIRGGMIASPLKSKFDDKEEFLIDIECSNGSSGSPIFLQRQDEYYLAGIEYSSICYDNMPIRLGKCINYNVLRSYLQ